MKYALLFLLLTFGLTVSAYTPLTIDSAGPYEEIVIPMGIEDQDRSYLGTLNGFPDLYEFELDDPASMNIKVRQQVVDDPLPVNLILLSVQPDTERITEVLRLNTPVNEREKKFVRQLGISLIESDSLQVELDPGLYRLEVSSPRNDNRYELDFGNESVDNTYFGTFSTIRQVQKHFGYSLFRYPLSSYVYHQIGIILLILGIGYTWRKRKIIANDT